MHDTAPTPPDQLTDTQVAVLATINDSVTRRGFPPSIREIGDAVGLSSTSSVAYQLQTLERRGYIRRHRDRPRAIEIIHRPAPITPQAAGHVLFEYGHRGREAGQFTRALIEAIARADVTNRAVLARSYPAYVTAVNTIERNPDGHVELARIAGYPVAAEPEGEVAISA